MTKRKKLKSLGSSPAQQSRTRRIHCCGCSVKVKARLTTGAEVYPARRDLVSLPFWICDRCKNFVGCAHKTGNPTKPLGCIATPGLKNARKHLHALLDPLWKTGKIGRRELYARIGRETGREYHTAELKTLEEARQVYRIGIAIAKTLSCQEPIRTT